MGNTEYLYKDGLSREIRGYRLVLGHVQTLRNPESLQLFAVGNPQKLKLVLWLVRLGVARVTAAISSRKNESDILVGPRGLEPRT